MNIILHFEQYIYLSIWILANFYSLLSLVQTQNEILENNPQLAYSLRDLTHGWAFVDRLRDISDVEWSTWKHFIQTSWVYLILQFAISEIIRKTKLTCLKHWYIISSIMFVLIYWGWKPLIIILMQPVIFSTIIFLGGKKTSIWLTSIVLLMSYNSLKYKYYFWNFLDYKHIQDEEVYLVLFAVAWIELRCISFCVDYINKKEKFTKEKAYKVSIYQAILDMFSYVLYAPLLYVGPIMLYEDFEKSFTVKNEKYTTKLKRFVWDMLLYLFYTFLLDLSFHYVYFYALQSNIEAIKSLPTLALCGGGLWMGLVFHLKYVISYGTTGAFARLDNMEPPPIPRCVARIHVYSLMWRYFDVGLYQFLSKYIYKPGYSVLSNSLKLSKFVNKLIASLATFIFIFMWHGTVWNIFVWSSLNYIGILLEYTGKAVSSTEGYKWFRTKILRSNSMENRWIAFLCSPLLALSAISNFYLLAGSEIGDLFFGLLKGPTWSNCFIISLSLYCCCQISIALKDIPSRTDIRKISEKKNVNVFVPN